MVNFSLIFLDENFQCIKDKLSSHGAGKIYRDISLNAVGDEGTLQVTVQIPSGCSYVLYGFGAEVTNGANRTVKTDCHVDFL